MIICLVSRLLDCSSDATRKVSGQPQPFPIRSCFGWGLPSQPVSRLLVRSYRTFPPLPAMPAVYLCCTFPEVAFGGRYPLSLPCGARTFLTWALFSADARLSVPVVFILLYFGGNVKRIAKFIPSGYNMGVVQRLRRAAQGKEGHRS